jgi:RNA processing factor Prp31
LLTVAAVIAVGELVGARLISHAGSLMNLAKHPASTVQILGAEKALFKVSHLISYRFLNTSVPDPVFLYIFDIIMRDTVALHVLYLIVYLLIDSHRPK